MVYALLVFVAVALLAASAGVPSTAAAASLSANPTCTGPSTTSVEFTWAQPEQLPIEWWLDISLWSDGFEPGTFLGTGPLPPTATGVVWEGILANLPHFYRVNAVYPDGWRPSEAGVFEARCLPGEASLGGYDSPFSLYPGLYTLDIETGVVTRIEDLREHSDIVQMSPRFDWSPDGTSLALLRTPSDYRTTWLSIYDEQSGARSGELEGRFWELDWLATGKISVQTEANDQQAVALVDPATSSFSAMHAGFGGSGDWSPDGRQIVQPWQPVGPDGGPGGVYLTDIESGAHRLLVAGQVSFPRWSPDGAMIVVWTHDESGDSSWLSVRNAETGDELQRLRFASETIWAPHSRSIAGVEQTFDGEAASTRLLVQDAGTGQAIELGAGSNPSWSPDGEFLSFVRDGELWVVDVRTGAERPLLAAQLPAINDVVWSPTGRHIAFDTLGGGSGIYTIDADGQSERYVGPGFAPTWSAASNRIAFTFGQSFGLGFGGHVFSMAPDASRINRLGTYGVGDVLLICETGRGPEWSPDGTKVAFGSQVPRGVFVAEDRPSTQVRHLGFGGAPSWSADSNSVAYHRGEAGMPSCHVSSTSVASGATSLLVAGAMNPEWSPDGRHLAFETGQTLGPAGTTRILGAGMTPVAEIARAGGLEWSPDGSSVAFLRTASDPPPGTLLLPPNTPRQLVTASPDGTGERVLAEAPNVFGFAWSPGGTHIAYATSEPSEPPQIFVVETEGESRPRRLTQGSQPTWSPDGRTIAFSR
ncbi:MAG: hypothetical protein GEU75_08040 [Dehalococcoidia bacterium]|nr:hypothetical protein [Dehalococcoidia bacterium]